MMFLPFLAAALTFTATATGVDKGTAVEFLFVGKGSDRDYESMFVVDDSPDEFCRKAEAAGLPRGYPTDGARCRLWPSGCKVTLEPSLDRYVQVKMPEGLSLSDFVYTGGARDEKGACVANEEMPVSIMALYSISQSPVVLNGIYDQGAVYGAFSAKEKLEKGTKVSFTLTWDDKSAPRHLELMASAGNGVQLINALRQASASGEIDATVAFDGQMEVREARSIANALSAIDSSRVKINGFSNIFYRAFMPLVKWRDRQERLQQPFELILENDGSEKLLFISEDWTVEGSDPKLTPQVISFEDAPKHDRTDTCFMFVSPTEKLSRLFAAMKKLQDSKVRNWYVFDRE